MMSPLLVYYEKKTNKAKYVTLQHYRYLVQYVLARTIARVNNKMNSNLTIDAFCEAGLEGLEKALNVSECGDENIFINMAVETIEKSILDAVEIIGAIDEQNT